MARTSTKYLVPWPTSKSKHIKLILPILRKNIRKLKKKKKTSKNYMPEKKLSNQQNLKCIFPHLRRIDLLYLILSYLKFPEEIFRSIVLISKSCYYLCYSGYCWNKVISKKHFINYPIMKEFLFIKWIYLNQIHSPHELWNLNLSNWIQPSKVNVSQLGNFLKKLLMRFQHLKILELPSWLGEKINILEIVRNIRMNNLLKLSISVDNTSSAINFFKIIPMKFPSLNSINIGIVSNSEIIDFSEESRVQIISCKKLFLSMNSNLSKVVFQFILSYFVKLKELMVNCRVINLNSPIHNNIIRNLKYLYFNFVECSIDFLTHIIHNNLTLQMLSIQDSSNNNPDSQFKKYSLKIEGMPFLETVSSYAMIVFQFKNCPTLKYLTGILLNNDLSELPSLKELSSSFMSWDDKYMNGSNIKRFLELDKLHIRSFETFFQSDYFGGDSQSLTLQMNPRLLEVKMNLSDYKVLNNIETLRLHIQSQIYIDLSEANSLKNLYFHLETLDKAQITSFKYPQENNSSINKFVKEGYYGSVKSISEIMIKCTKLKEFIYFGTIFEEDKKLVVSNSSLEFFKLQNCSLQSIVLNNFTTSLKKVFLFGISIQKIEIQSLALAKLLLVSVKAKQISFKKCVNLNKIIFTQSSFSQIQFPCHFERLSKIIYSTPNSDSSIRITWKRGFIPNGNQRINHVEYKELKLEEIRKYFFSLSQHLGKEIFENISDKIGVFQGNY